MRTLGSLLALFVLTAAHAHAQNAGAVLPPGVNGIWNVCQRVYTPSDSTQAYGDLLTNLGTKVLISGDKIAALDDGKMDNYLHVEFPAGQQINFKVPPDKMPVIVGIYRLDDDVLTIIVSINDARPNNFDVMDNQIKLVLKRPLSSN